MNDDLFDGFISKKKADSAFLTVEDGEFAKVLKLREVKMITKTGFGGEEKEVIRLVVDVDTVEGIKTKFFDNGTQRFAQELKDKGVKVGCGFTLSRVGQQTKTRYTVSDVTGGSPVAQTTTPPAAPAPTTTTPPAGSVAPAGAAVAPKTP